MSKQWPKVKLGEVATQSDRAVPSAQLTEVELAGVYSFGRGLFKRGPMSPAGTSYKKYNRLVAGDFVISQPKAWEGALALVTPEFDGMFLSPVFPTFQLNRDALLPEYLEWFARRPEVWSDLRRDARGMGARRESVSPEQFLGLEIPLPPLDEQQRIVAYLDALSAKITQARTLRQQQEVQAAYMLRSAFDEITAGALLRPMREVAPLVRRPVNVDARAGYPELGIRSFGKGTFHKPALSGLELGSKRVFWIEPNDLLFSNVFAWEGAIAVATQDDVGRVGSHRFISRRVDPKLATPQFLCFYFLTPDGLEKIRAASPGGAGRNRTLGLEALDEIEAPIPPVAEQVRFDGLLEGARELRRQQSNTGTALDALQSAAIDRAFKGEL